MEQSEIVHPIRAYRESRKPRIRQAELAKRIGTTKTTLSEIENGKRPVSMDLLPKIEAETGISAKILRPDVAKLFGGRR